MILSDLLKSAEEKENHILSYEDTSLPLNIASLPDIKIPSDCKNNIETATLEYVGDVDGTIPKIHNEALKDNVNSNANIDSHNAYHVHTHCSVSNTDKAKIDIKTGAAESSRKGLESHCTIAAEGIANTNLVMNYVMDHQMADVTNVTSTVDDDAIPRSRNQPSKMKKFFMRMFPCIFKNSSQD